MGKSILHVSCCTFVLLLEDAALRCTRRIQRRHETEIEFVHSTDWEIAAGDLRRALHRRGQCCLPREGANREKLTVKKIINAWRCFFTVYVPYKP